MTAPSLSHLRGRAEVRGGAGRRRWVNTLRGMEHKVNVRALLVLAPEQAEDLGEDSWTVRCHL